MSNKLFKDLNKIYNIISEGSNKTDRGSYLDDEMDELQRVVQTLNRDEGFNISVDNLYDKFLSAKPKKLSNSIWNKLENTESNEIDKGDFDEVEKIAKKYNKSNPDKLKKSLSSGDYKRPMIVRFDDRYHLVAGNTRLCTAAAMGINPEVLIVNI